MTGLETLSGAALRHALLHTPALELIRQAARLRDAGHGNRISYSRKVFISLTHLCRDVCHYCTFAETPQPGKAAYLSPDEVLAIARAGQAAGCQEALFTLGDKPELRYQTAREALDALGYQSTVEYLAAMCALVLRETGLLPHANPGVMSGEEIATLREVTVSQGIMLESASPRLCEKGGPHYGSPDKHPAVRLESILLAGELKVPFTSGILIGIGETRDERLDALFALKALHDCYGHIQEIIVQNFRAKADTRMRDAVEPSLEDLAWTIAATRLIFGPAMNIQCPPNLSPGEAQALIGAGINDWGGVSPVTPDHVNPEAPWPAIERLGRETAEAGKVLVRRLAAYPSYCLQAAEWMTPGIATAVRRSIDAEGFARIDDWAPGLSRTPPQPVASETLAVPAIVEPSTTSILDRAMAGGDLSESQIVELFGARGRDFDAVCSAADELRQVTVGDAVTYTVNRNINYTNICYFRCGFCAFSKGKMSETLRGAPYDLALEEIVRRAEEAWARGGNEVCLQGGIHPSYTGETYLGICRAIKAARPEMHIHAFSPLEISQGASTLGIPVRDFLLQLKDAGLGTLPGTAAEVLDDEVRAIICPDKLDTREWLDVVRTAHEVGLRTTSTIMFGHVDQPIHWARHLIRLRELQWQTGGITEFVPLPFVHMEAPIYLKGKSRKGPSFREAVLMHAIARLTLNGVIPNIQTSWVKLGPHGAAACLKAGANDLGGILMNESISRAAGTEHGQEFPPSAMEALIRSLGRTPRQRDTLYRDVAADRVAASFAAGELQPLVMNAPVKRIAAE
ncbi:MAG: 5-amino-6-(D-ribitylamino)uracil--L-tyrosine 4-hydroxyphenyl transferase CofH [Reyranellaceae bacterium]